MTAATASIANPEKKLIAPLWHTVVLLILMAAPVIFGILRQSGGNPGSQVYANHSVVFLRFYVPVLIFEWLGVLYVNWGLKLNGGSLRELIGGRWTGIGDILRDVLLGVGFLLAGVFSITLTLHFLGPIHAKQISVVLPQSPMEFVVWILISLTAGFVEELLYRGYLQTQFVRLGAPVALAIVLQALIFGAGHSWEGLQRAAGIGVFALVGGAFAAWRRSLRPNMIGHAAMDILAAFVRSV